MLPFVTDINNYYWGLLLLFAFLSVEKESVGLGFAALTAAFAAIGLIHPISGIGLYTWASVAMVPFLVWTALVFAVRARAGRKSPT